MNRRIDALMSLVQVENPKKREFKYPSELLVGVEIGPEPNVQLEESFLSRYAHREDVEKSYEDYSVPPSKQTPSHGEAPAPSLTASVKSGLISMYSKAKRSIKALATKGKS